MYKSILGNALAITIIALLDAAFVPSLPFSLHRLHLLYLAIIFILLLSNVRMAAWWALGGALVLEIFSFRFFGSYLITAFFALLVAYILFERVMTNRSVFSVMTVTAAATAVADLVFLAFDYWSTRATLPFGGLIIAFGESLLVNIAAAGLIFYISNIFSRRLKPVFLPFVHR